MEPTDGRITQEVFAENQASGQEWPHTGRDYAANRGDTVRTIADGTVIAVGSGPVPIDLANRFMLVPGSDFAGNYVFIQHDGWVEYVAHLETIEVKVGQRVKRGQRIGGAGDSGAAQGVHVHYEVIVEPCAPTFPWGRYHPQAQINLEDSLANGTELEDMPLSKEDILLMQKMHDVTRDYVIEQVTKNTQKQQDVTREWVINQITNKGQAQEDVTRQYLSDRIQETK